MIKRLITYLNTPLAREQIKFSLEQRIVARQLKEAKAKKRKSRKTRK